MKWWGGRTKRIKRKGKRSSKRVKRSSVKRVKAKRVKAKRNTKKI